MRKASNRISFITAAALGIGAALSAIAAGHGSSEEKNIVEVATEAGSFTTLLAALDATALTSTLEGDGPFTVFAPTDAAFAALPEGALDQLLANPDELKQILTMHVVSGRALAEDVATLSEVTTVQGTVLPIETVSGVSVGGAQVLQADVMAGNGVIHVIDRVILPQS